MVEFNEKYKISLFIIILFGSFFPTYFFFKMYANGAIFTHLWYIPIIVAASWWKRKAYFVVGIILILQYMIYFYEYDLPMPYNLHIRSSMLLVIGVLAIMLSEKRAVAENALKRHTEGLEQMVAEKTGELSRINQELQHEIIEHKKDHEIIQSYAKELEESNQLKKLYNDIMAHDLNNPLNIVSNYIEMLPQHETAHQNKEYLKKIQKNLDRVFDIVDNSAKLSELESKDNIPFEELDLQEIIEQVIRDHEILVEQSGMKVENNITCSLPVRANIIIKEVFANLITNAVKYASEGKKVVIDSSDMNNHWIIRVKDFGPGIDDAYKTRIFDRFSQMEKQEVIGSGLGLAIAGRIADLHMAQLFVEDNPEGGAVFVLEMEKSEYQSAGQDKDE